VAKETQFIRPRVLATGLFLLAVPTFFTVFPTWADWHAVVRGLILVAWCVAAMFGVSASAKRDEAIDTLSEEARETQRQLHISAVLALTEALLRPSPQGIPSHYDRTVYVFDGAQLVPFWPVWEEGGPDLRIFSPGTGATGTAWQRKQSVFVKGSAVANDQYGLTKEQQGFFADHQVVVATPISFEGENPIGILTVLSKRDDGHFENEGAERVLRNFADVLGVLIHKLLEHPADLIESPEPVSATD
jgi:hypothetical protein